MHEKFINMMWKINNTVIKQTEMRFIIKKEEYILEMFCCYPDLKLLHLSTFQSAKIYTHKQNNSSSAYFVVKHGKEHKFKVLES